VCNPDSAADTNTLSDAYTYANTNSNCNPDPIPSIWVL
jgi:hypothetical protein